MGNFASENLIFIPEGGEWNYICLKIEGGNFQWNSIVQNVCKGQNQLNFAKCYENCTFIPIQNNNNKVIDTDELLKSWQKISFPCEHHEGDVYNKDNFGKYFLFLLSSFTEFFFWYLGSSVLTWFFKKCAYLTAAYFFELSGAFKRTRKTSCICFPVIVVRRLVRMWLKIEKPRLASALPIGITNIVCMSLIVFFRPGDSLCI